MGRGHSQCKGSGAGTLVIHLRNKHAVQRGGEGVGRAGSAGTPGSQDRVELFLPVVVGSLWRILSRE